MGEKSVSLKQAFTLSRRTSKRDALKARGPCRFILVRMVNPALVINEKRAEW